MDAQTLAGLVSYANSKIPELDAISLKVSYTLLLEMTANTFDHAGGAPGREPWWASVYVEPELRKAYFAVMDHGVGIFGSTSFRERVARWRQTVVRDRGIMLQKLLLGQVPSRTGKVNRGNGLPSARQRWTEGRIKRLIVLSNDAFADLEHNRFEQLTASFPGTLIYWEV